MSPFLPADRSPEMTKNLFKSYPHNKATNGNARQEKQLSATEKTHRPKTKPAWKPSLYARNVLKLDEKPQFCF